VQLSLLNFWPGASPENMFIPHVSCIIIYLTANKDKIPMSDLDFNFFPCTYCISDRLKINYSIEHENARLNRRWSSPQGKPPARGASEIMLLVRQSVQARRSADVKNNVQIHT
jgi:hypothetical protein